MSRAVHRFYHHHWMYDFDTLNAILTEVGFSQVIRQKYQQSNFPPSAELDRESHAHDSVYVDAIK